MSDERAEWNKMVARVKSEGDKEWGAVRRALKLRRPKLSHELSFDEAWQQAIEEDEAHDEARE